MPTRPGWANHGILPAALVADQKILWGFRPGIWEGMKSAERVAQFRDDFAAETPAIVLIFVLPPPAREPVHRPYGADVVI